jgi:hypothetical protein
VAGAVNAGVNGFNAIEDGGGFTREIKGGEMKARWYRLGGTRGAELGGARWPRIGGGAGELGRLEVGDGADSRCPVVRGTRERWPAREGVNQKGKRTSTNAPSTHGLAGPARLDSARERREASGSRVGRKVGWAESKEKKILN